MPVRQEVKGETPLLPKPMLAKKMARIPHGKGWWMEPKYDGWRVLAALRDHVVMWTRQGHFVTQVPYITAAIAEQFPAGTILDGEVVDLRTGRQWNRTQSILGSTRGNFEHHPTDGDPPLTYVVFDILCIAGQDVRSRPLRERRAILEEHCAALDSSTGDGVLALTSIQPPSDAGLDALLALGFEGVVCKDASSPYLCGSRRGGWGKIKPHHEVEAVCTGTYKAEPGSRYAPIVKGKPRPWAVGGICFCIEHDDGRVFNGRAAGMNDKVRADLHEHHEQFIGLIVELTHWGITDNGALRWPQIKRFRALADKAPASTASTNRA